MATCMLLVEIIWKDAPFRESSGRYFQVLASKGKVQDIEKTRIGWRLTGGRRNKRKQWGQNVGYAACSTVIFQEVSYLAIKVGRLDKRGLRNAAVACSASALR
jgi:hypothetical protein